MKIGISVQCNETQQDYERWEGNCYEKLRGLGYTHIDLNMADTETNLYTCDEKAFEEILTQEKQLMEAAGMEVSQVHGPWRWPPRDCTPEDREERMEKMKQSIRGTALIGCKNWVVHPIMPHGIEDKNTVYAKRTWDMNVEFMRELLKTAKEYHVTICLENMPMPNFSIGSPTEILKFVKMMDDEHFKICLDTGHVAVYPEGSPAAAVRELGKEIRVLHVHDNNGHADQHQIPYFGVIDWKDFGRALKEIGFCGVFSFETMPPKKLPTSVFQEMLKVLVKIAEEITA